MPDTDDLRILAELINNVRIPLAQAAWNARMSTAEAAARLITMAERGMPLRLVAEGDRQTLWRIAQAGPATSGVPLPPGPRPTPRTPGPAPERPTYSGAVPQPPGYPAGPGPRPAPPAGYGPAPVAPAPDRLPGPGGPAAGAGAPAPASGPAYPPPYPPGPPAAPGRSWGPQPAPMPSGPGLPPGPPGSGGIPVVLPPTPPVPPHEQAIAGAVPLGGPPFGPPSPESTPPAPAPAALEVEAPEPEQPEPEQPGPDLPTPPAGVPAVGPPEPAADATTPVPAAEATEPPSPPSEPEPAPAPAGVSTWGIPADFGWARTDPAAAPDASPAPAPSSAPAADGPVATIAAPDYVVPHGLLPHFRGEPAAKPEPEPDQELGPYPSQSTAGLSGERLTVTLREILDPADERVLAVGYQLDDGERAVLVGITVGNAGPADFPALPDMYLSLRTRGGERIEKAALSVPGYPGHRVGIEPGQESVGWTVFLLPNYQDVTAVVWAVRPDLEQQTLTWPVNPPAAPAAPAPDQPDTGW